MDILEKIEKYLDEASVGKYIDTSKAMTGLFGGKEKKRLLMKSADFWTKIGDAIFLSSKEMEGKIGLNADRIRDVLKQQGFDSNEIEYIRKVTIKAAKTVSRYLNKKYGVEISEIPQNFPVYTIVMGSKGWSDEVEDEWNRMFKKEVERNLGK